MTAIAQDRPASTLELFFDLVFAFGITQLTSVLADDPMLRRDRWFPSAIGDRLIWLPIVSPGGP